MKRSQGGFTLIELVVVIVILGILAATALPKFIDLRGDANEAAFQGVRGSMASAMAINYAGCSATSNVVTANKCARVNSCEDVTNVLQGGTPTGYAVATLVAFSPASTNGGAGTCSLTLTGYSAVGTTTFTGIAAAVAVP